MSVTYAAVLPACEKTSGSWPACWQRTRPAPRPGRAVHDQAVLLCPSLVAGRHPSQAVGPGQRHQRVNRLGLPTRRHRRARCSITEPARRAAGREDVNIDGMLIETDRCHTPGPTPGVDLWWSGKHDNHGGNIQVITAPNGWPSWTSDARPGPPTRRHRPARPHQVIGCGRRVHSTEKRLNFGEAWAATDNDRAGSRATPCIPSSEGRLAARTLIPGGSVATSHALLLAASTPASSTPHGHDSADPVAGRGGQGHTVEHAARWRSTR
jgi:hypothetical protein